MQNYLIHRDKTLTGTECDMLINIAEVQVPRRFDSPKRFVLCGSEIISGEPVLLEGKMGFHN